MKPISGVLFPQVGMRWPRSTKLASAFLPLLAGLVLALLVLKVGPITLPIVFFVLLILPWLLQDPFRLFIWLIITWPILALYARIPLPAGVPDLSYDRALVLLLLCVVLLQALLSKRRLLKITSLDILVILYVVAQLSSRLFVIWFGGMGKPDLNGLLDIILVPVVLYWMAKNLVASRAQLKWFLYALVIASLLICPTGLYEQAVGTRIFKASIAMGGSEVVYQWIDAQGRLRAAGALANPAIYGAVLGVGSLAAICCLSLAKRKLAQAALLAIIGFLLVGVFASYTRSAWLSVFAVLFVAQFCINGLWKRTLPVFMLVLLVLVITWNLLPDTGNVVQRAMTAQTINQRLEVNYLAWDRFLERPFLGWGSGALSVFGTRAFEIISHNTYLSFLVDVGLVLLLSFAAVVGCVLSRAIRVYQMTERGSLERNAVVAATGSILIFLLSGLALELRFFGYFNALFWICAGVIDGLGERCSWTNHPH